MQLNNLSFFDMKIQKQMMGTDSKAHLEFEKDVWSIV